jgi:hypothetical protein
VVALRNSLFLLFSFIFLTNNGFASLVLSEEKNCNDSETKIPVQQDLKPYEEVPGSKIKSGDTEVRYWTTKPRSPAIPNCQLEQKNCANSQNNQNLHILVPNHLNR